MFTFLNLFHPRANGVLKKNLPCLYPKFPTRPLSVLPFSFLSFLFLSAIQAKFRINPYYVVIQSFSHTIWQIQSLSFLIFWCHLVVQFTHIKNKIFYCESVILHYTFCRSLIWTTWGISLCCLWHFDSL